MNLLLPEDDSYRTCSECGADAEPQPFTAEGHISIAFVCRQHGVRTVISPFDPPSNEPSGED